MVDSTKKKVDRASIKLAANLHKRIAHRAIDAELSMSEMMEVAWDAYESFSLSAEESDVISILRTLTQTDRNALTELIRSKDERENKAAGAGNSYQKQRKAG